MKFKSNKAAVLVAMKLCKKEFCEGVGTLVVGEAQNLVPVLNGHLKRSITSDVMSGDVGIEIGSNMPYALAIEKGHSQKAPGGYLEPGAMNAIPKIINVATSLYRSKLGGA